MLLFICQSISQRLQKLLKTKFGTILLLLLLIVAAVAVTFGTGYEVGSHHSSIVTIDDGASITESNAKLESLSKVLSQADADKDVLRKQIALLQSQGQTIEYITRTETELIPSEPIVVMAAVPAEYYYKLSDGIVVGSFHSSEAGVRFETYVLHLDATSTLTKSKITTSVQVYSSYDPENKISVPVKTQEINVKTQTNSIALGIGFNLPKLTNQTSNTLNKPALANIFLEASVIHPIPNLDILNPGIGITLASHPLPIARLDVLRYNIGKPLPVVDDLWIGLGIQSDTQFNKSVTLALSSNL